MQELLRLKRDEIVQGWVDRTLSIFPAGSVKFLKGNSDPFANPMGTTLSNEIESLFDAVLSEAPGDELGPHLDRIVRITCIQDIEPSRAIAFVFELKGVVRKVLASELRDRRALERLLQWEARIDELAMRVFDSYTRHRRRISDLRIGEMKRKVSTLVKMAGLDWDDLPSSENTQGGCGR